MLPAELSAWNSLRLPYEAPPPPKVNPAMTGYCVQPPGTTIPTLETASSNIRLVVGALEWMFFLSSVYDIRAVTTCMGHEKVETDK